jgi:hypothetical protein
VADLSTRIPFLAGCQYEALHPIRQSLSEIAVCGDGRRFGQSRRFKSASAIASCAEAHWVLVQPASAGFSYQTPVSTGGPNNDQRLNMMAAFDPHERPTTSLQYPGELFAR